MRASLSHIALIEALANRMGHICPSSSTSRRLTTAHGWEWLVIVFVTLNQKNTQLVA
jgi:hypothetical protein